MFYQLLIFDADEVSYRNGTLLPAMVTWRLCNPNQKIALVTNQPEPALHDAGWKNSHKKPSLDEIEAIYSALAETLVAKLYMSLVYQRGDRIYYPIAANANDERLSLTWKLPNSGMMLKAMDDAGATPQDTLVVADNQIARKAALAVGCDFMWAHDFF